MPSSSVSTAISERSDVDKPDPSRRYRWRRRFFWGLGLLIGASPFLAAGGLFLTVYASSVANTQYAPGYSRQAFAKVKVDMSAEQVLSLLGMPIRKKEWDRGSKWVCFRNGGRVLFSGDICLSEGIDQGLLRDLKVSNVSYEEFTERCGGKVGYVPVRVESWYYSISHGNGNEDHQMRKVILDTRQGVVIGKVAKWNWD